MVLPAFIFYSGLAGEYIEPNEELSFRNFAAMLSARVAAFVKLKRE
jgi:hypothetical protein